MHETQLSWLEALHTYNALTSWSLLDGVDIIMFGNDNACKFALEVFLIIFLPLSFTFLLFCFPQWLILVFLYFILFYFILFWFFI